MAVTTIDDESTKRKRGVPDELSDDYIFNEINLYANRSIGLNNTAEHVDVPNVPVNIQKLGGIDEFRISKN